jgi:hypothetical protein
MCDHSTGAGQRKQRRCLDRRPLRGAPARPEHRRSQSSRRPARARARRPSLDATPGRPRIPHETASGDYRARDAPAREAHRAALRWLGDAGLDLGRQLLRRAARRRRLRARGRLVYGRLCPNAAGGLFNERGEYLAELVGDRLVVNRAKRRPAWRADDLPGGWSRLTPRPADRKPAAASWNSAAGRGARLDRRPSHASSRARSRDRSRCTARAPARGAPARSRSHAGTSRLVARHPYRAAPGRRQRRDASGSPPG